MNGYQSLYILPNYHYHVIVQVWKQAETAVGWNSQLCGVLIIG
jgi:hypothetical protein